MHHMSRVLVLILIFAWFGSALQRRIGAIAQSQVILRYLVHFLIAILGPISGLVVVQFLALLNDWRLRSVDEGV